MTIYHVHCLCYLFLSPLYVSYLYASRLKTKSADTFKRDFYLPLFHPTCNFFLRAASIFFFQLICDFCLRATSIRGKLLIAKIRYHYSPLCGRTSYELVLKYVQFRVRVWVRIVIFLCSWREVYKLQSLIRISSSSQIHLDGKMDD